MSVVQPVTPAPPAKKKKEAVCLFPRNVSGKVSETLSEWAERTSPWQQLIRKRRLNSDLKFGTRSASKHLTLSLMKVLGGPTRTPQTGAPAPSASRVSSITLPYHDLGLSLP